MPIDGSTKVLGIIGDPVAHSLSPVMQNAAISAAGINAVYLPFHVSPEVLGAAIESVRALGLLGVNVTVPHKETVIPFLDELDPVAEMIGAVNTIVNREGRLIGCNTDGKGFMRSLQQHLDFQPSRRKIVLLGAGGAARAALVVLAQADAAEIVIVNRTAAHADRLVSEFSARFPGCVIRMVELDGQGLIDALAETHLLVNTTTVGLHGDNFPVPIVQALGAGAALYDMVYAAGLTPLQQAASDRGVKFADGRGMLAAQGEVAFELWFGTAPPVGIMHSRVIK